MAGVVCVLALSSSIFLKRLAEIFRGLRMPM